MKDPIDTGGTLDIAGAVQERVLHGRRMSLDQAKDVMNQVMDGQATQAQLGAFLVALRVVEPSTSEIVGFVTVMKERARRIAPAVAGRLVDTCGTGGDAFKTVNVSTMAALVAAAAGLPVAKHGNRSMTSPCGSADLFEALGVNLMAEPAIVERSILTTGIGFMFAPVFHPAMKHVAGPRKEIGIRTVFNILGPLTNPAGATAHLLGAFDPGIMNTMADVLDQTGVDRYIIVHGEPGADELLPCGENVVITRDEEGRRASSLRAGDFGMEQRDASSFPVVRSFDEIVTASVEILAGRGHPAFVDTVIMNAAIAILVGDRATGLIEAAAIAREAVVAGAGMDVLERLVSASGGDMTRFEAVVKGRGGS